MAPVRKRLEGVTATPALWSLYEDCLVVCEKVVETKPLLTAVSTEDSEAVSPTKNNAAGTTTALIRALSLEEACTAVAEFQTQIKQKRKRPKILPILVVRSMQVLLENNNDNNNGAPKLEDALGDTQLQFTPPEVLRPPESSDKTKKWNHRMEQLRLQNEESKYYKLTQNIGNAPVSDDRITTKSMTYAASVGLNMIVAPISFGVFMFFFSGPVLGFLWRNYEPPSHPGAVDVRKVIIGVLSGVAMLFIEMLLFVIRTHELDGAIRKKQKKKGRQTVKPFGEYSSKSKKEYTTKEE